MNRMRSKEFRIHMPAIKLYSVMREISSLSLAFYSTHRKAPPFCQSRLSAIYSYTLEIPSSLFCSNRLDCSYNERRSSGVWDRVSDGEYRRRANSVLHLNEASFPSSTHSPTLSFPSLQFFFSFFERKLRALHA